MKKFTAMVKSVVTSNKFKKLFKAKINETIQHLRYKRDWKFYCGRKFDAGSIKKKK